MTASRACACWTSVLALAAWAATGTCGDGEEHGEGHHAEPTGRATMLKFVDAGIPNDPAEGGDPPGLGQWAAPVTWPVVAIHAAVMPTGEVLHYSWPSGLPGSKARLWNPVSNTFANVDIADDIFCSGHSHLADGRLYVTGGNASGCDFKGIRDTNIFDAVTRTWSAQQLMQDGRWYPTNVTMPDGRVFIFTGLNQTCTTNTGMEMFTPDGLPGGGGAISVVPEGTRTLQLYPRMHILPNSKLAHVGPENAAWTFQLGTGWQHVDNSSFGWRGQGTSVSMPGQPNKIMTLCGNSPLTLTTEFIDFSQPAPVFVYGPPIHFSRGHANALILPDKTILLVGGGQDGLYGMPVITPELYDPVTNTWTMLPSHVHGRMYHSTLVLLPDGRALSAGQDNGPGSLTAEIYSPRYMFRGARPVISPGGAPTIIRYGQTFTLDSPQATEIASVVLIKLSSVTHSVNFEQRLVDLNYAAMRASSLNATAPPTANHAPPGYYLLFILNGNRVPSVGAMVRLAPPRPGDVNRDGVVNITDLLAVIAAWGSCGAAPPGMCLADVHPYSVVVSGNGVVNIEDLLLVISNWG